MITHPLEYFDDLEILNNDLSNLKSDGVTLLSRVKNESYFIEAFLAHYRNIGVTRFIFIDDDSSDGTREYLFEQADCMVLGSCYTYNGEHPISQVERKTSSENLSIIGSKNIWINLLFRKFAIGSWAIFADADEFLRLPDNIGIEDVIIQLENAGSNAAWGVMLDVYPRSIFELNEMSKDEKIDRSREWFFDAVPHLRLVQGEYPKHVYGGSRARLMQKFRTGRLMKPYFKSKVRQIKGKVPKFNNLVKTMLVKIPQYGYFRDVHFPYFTIDTRVLLPFDHYKFSGHIINRSYYAVSSGVYAANSFQYTSLSELLTKMERADGSFLCRASKSTSDFQNYTSSNNVQGLT